MKTALEKKIESLAGTAVELQRELTSRPAIPPNMGGTGELERALFLEQWCEEHGIEKVERFDARDDRAPSGIRPNLVITLPGKDQNRSVWIIAHLDIVPPGEADAWKTDPHSMVEQEGILYGRGVEDNQQGIVTALIALLAMKELAVIPRYNLKVLLAADEESGSDMGAKYLIDNHPELFGPEDEFIVPDGGVSDGSAVQVAEKNIFVFRFTTYGRQAHAARPHTGINAFVAASDLVVALDGMNDYFSDRKNWKFTPPTSTFVPSRKEANVQATNVLPGEDRFYMDCRVLPELELQEIKDRIDILCRRVEDTHKVRVEWELTSERQTGFTRDDAPIVTRLRRVIEDIRGIETRTVGIGGGTIAGDFRKFGRDAVVWCTIDGTAHMPNEYCLVENLLADAKVFGAYCLDQG
jgi:succinyl-diaminopimelate desuccinylase